MQSGVYQYNSNFVFNGNSITDGVDRKYLSYLAGQNHISKQHNQKYNEISNLIFLSTMDIVKKLLIIVGTMVLIIVASLIGGIGGIVLSLPVGIGIIFLLVRDLLLYFEERKDYIKEKADLRYEYAITAIKELKIPIYLNKLNDQELIISDASHIFSPTRFNFQNMNDKDIIKDGFDHFNTKFEYLNRFMMMPSRGDYINILKEEGNTQAIRNKLVESMLNPSFEIIKNAFSNSNISESHITLNAVKFDDDLAKDIEKIFLSSQKMQDVPDLIHFIQQKKDEDWLIYQSVDDLNNIIKDLQDWINTIIRSSLPTYLKNNKESLSSKLNFHSKKIDNLSTFVDNTFHKDLELFNGFNIFHFCKSCGSTNINDIMEKTDIRQYVERVLLNNATKDDILQIDQAPEIVHEFLEDNSKLIDNKISFLPVFQKIQKTDWSEGINRESLPTIMADFKLMDRVKNNEGNYIYRCPVCAGNESIQVNRSLEPIAHSYLSNMHNLKMKMEKEKNTFIRNISDIKLAKQQKEMDIGQYELAYMEAKQKTSDLDMQIEIAEKILSELQGGT